MDRRPSSAARMRARVENTRGRLESQRATDNRIDAAFRWIRLQTEAGGPLLAGALAFRFFLFLLPCVFVLVVGLGVSAEIASADPRQLARSFGMAGLAATAVQAADHASTPARWWTLALAAVALVLGARNLVRALFLTHALIWRMAPAKPRRTVPAALVLIAIFFAGLLALRLVYAVRSASLLGWLVAVVVFCCIPALVWECCSLSFFPHPKGLTWRNVLPGSVLFGVGVEGLHLATILWFAPYLQSKSETYGAIGAALAILVWAYLAGQLVTAAAVLNAVLAQPRRESRVDQG